MMVDSNGAESDMESDNSESEDDISEYEGD